MAENRLARELERRDTAKRAEAWTPPSLLPTPAPQEGVVFRWIRVSMMGQSDPSNVASSFRQGWVPCKAEDHPEIATAFGDPTSRYAGNIENGGLLLCRAPVEMANARSAYYRNQAGQQMQSVDNSYMRQNDPRMPVFSEKRSEVTFGRGTK
jgi:hypothetical protein